jgi:hypothetical protein
MKHGRGSTMGHRLGLCLGVALVAAWTAGPPASAWMVNVDVEWIPVDGAKDFDMILDGHALITGGGKSSVTNPFPNPNIQQRVVSGGVPNVTASGVRFIGIDMGDPVPNACGGTCYHFGVFGDRQPTPPKIKSLYWTDGSGANIGWVPAPSVSFAHLGGDEVRVTVSNETTNAITVSQVGYRKLAIDSFSLQHLNRTLMPPGSFTAATGTCGGSAALAPGGSCEFNVSGVALGDDLVVFVESNPDPAPEVANPTGMWVAWHSGTYIPARKAYLGRIALRAIDPETRSLDPEITRFDMVAKTPFDEIAPVVGAPARFLSVRRNLYSPGSTKGGEGSGFSAFAFDLMLSTTGPGGMKLSYLRTDGRDAYADVRVKARIMPGASSGGKTTTIAQSDDFGGPVAIRIQPTGGSYYASVVTGTNSAAPIKSVIGLMKDSIDGSTQTALATATQWANGDDIVLDHNVPDPVPPAADPPLYSAKVYDVLLQAVGSTLTLTVAEVGNADHTVTLGASDDTYTEGYVGLRTQRNGELDYAVDDFGDGSVKFETIVQNYVIENPTAAPLAKVAVISAFESRIDDPGQDNGTLPDERSAMVMNDMEVGDVLQHLGFAVDTWGGEYELDQYTYAGACVDGPDTSVFPAPALNTYDLLWITGTGWSGAMRDQAPWIATPLVFSENAGGGPLFCGGSSFDEPAHAGDPCAASGNIERRLGMYPDNAGDFSGGGGSVWGGNLGAAAQDLRIISAGEYNGQGDPTHPIVAGFPSGDTPIQVYAEMWRHMQYAGTPPAAGAKALAVERVRGAVPGAAGDGQVNPGRVAWGIMVADAGGAREIDPALGAAAPQQTFAARAAFLFIGDQVFHKLSITGYEIARRAAYWAMNQPIPTSPWMAYGDFNEDGDVDLEDFLHFQTCFNGPNRPYSFENGCTDADIDGDGDVDLVDFLDFQACFNGPNRPANAGCPQPPISIPGAM